MRRERWPRRTSATWSKTSSPFPIRFSSRFDLVLIVHLQPTCFQLRSQSFTSPRKETAGGRRRGLQEQSQSFTFHSEGGERRGRRQSYDLSNEGSRSKQGLPVRRRLQELLPGDGRQGERNGWERLQSIRRRLQEKRRREEKENVVETVTAVPDEEGRGGSVWLLDEMRGNLRRGEGVREEGSEEDFEMWQESDFEMCQGSDFEMRQGRERRQLMRSTSLTAPLSLRPAFPRSSDCFPNFSNFSQVIRLFFKLFPGHQIAFQTFPRSSDCFSNSGHAAAARTRQRK